MDSSDDAASHFLKNSVLYKEFLAEREEILKHKWIESEKAGSDIGFEKALLDLIVKHSSHWRRRRCRAMRATNAPPGPGGPPLKRTCDAATESTTTTPT